jgi:rhamnulokinase
MRFAAVDLGASSGRVMLARVGPDEFDLTEVHRFANYPVDAGGTLYWDILALYRETLTGLRGCGPLHGIGVDSWAVDYGLLDGSGALLGNPVSYRDARTDGVMERVLAELGAEMVYRTTGIQNLPFNTLFQLRARELAGAATMLLLPDLLGYWLTGEVGAEVTNASTTQLLDASTRQWSIGLAKRAGIPPALLPPLRQPGERIGLTRHPIGLGEVPVLAVGSHDTASAVVAVPAERDFAYISSGTWSLVGVELDAPVLTEASRQANFSNEAGVDATVRYLRNVMGLWLLQECLREWSTVDLDDVLAAAAAQPGLVSIVDPDRPEFLTPGDMPARLARACRQAGQPVPASPAAYARCVLDSLALAHRRAIRDAVRLSRRAVEVVHVVGGGSANRLLCQLTADACGLPVVAGPVEATAWGNALIQARALGAVSGDLAQLRATLRAHVQLQRYEPRGNPADWDAAERLAFGT